MENAALCVKRGRAMPSPAAPAYAALDAPAAPAYAALDAPAAPAYAALDAPAAPAAPAANAQPTMVGLPIQNSEISIPLFVPGRFDADLLRVLTTLGVSVLTLKEDADEYSISLSALGPATEALKQLRAGAAGAAGAARAQPAPRVRVPVGPINVPHWQPRIDAATRDLYGALGVRTTDVIYDGVPYTMLTDHIPETVRGGIEAAKGTIPRAAHVINAIWLQDFYRDAPPAHIRAIARTIGAKFICATKNGAAYWVLYGHAGTLATIERLGLATEA